MDLPAVIDLEKELTCSICTDLLYQPLTLLDCLHTFCGACLKEWFGWQALAAANAPGDAPDAPVSTCPSCRAAVRDTRHNATVATLLDMFVAAHPDKARPVAERDAMAARYRPGENILPLATERTPEQRRRDEGERRLVEEVRALSLREAVGESRPRHVRSREPSRDGFRHVREPRGTAGREDRQRAEQSVLPQSENVYADERRRRRQLSRQRSAESADGRRARGIEHQSSIRSLIGAAHVDALDVEREIEEFARQIQEEGLLDGLDLDTIDLTDNDELSKKITEAYRRRQRERTRHGRERRRSNASRDASVSSQPDDRGRYPPSASAHLEPHQPRQRRRTTSGERSSLAQPGIRPSAPSPNPATRNQRSRSRVEGRSPSMSTTVSPNSQPAAESVRGLPFHARMNVTAPGPATGSDLPRQTSPSLASPRRPQYYSEPCIDCSSCGKQHIEYELHHNCQTCEQGDWNLCLKCYRKGVGCHNWFGFGYGAFSAWDKAKKASGGTLTELPHTLTSNRYLRPKTMPGGPEGRRLTTEDPNERLQSGTFCQRCSAWTNECYWRCDFCNHGEWGYCTDCVNQGFCCTHPLLPLSYSPAPDSAQTTTPPASPRPARSATASKANTVGRFRPLAFSPPCRICHKLMPPSEYRQHCFACAPTCDAADARGRPGDYDVCDPCYLGLVADGTISPENGPGGWRRCPAGHRMVVVAFMVDGHGGQRRCIVRDRVGGRKLQFEAASVPGLQTCYWFEGERKLERSVTVHVGASSHLLAGALGRDIRLATNFPPDGGTGLVGTARWSWWRSQPDAADELMFPRGAEITEIDVANEEWCHGVYMGGKGLFPAAYVRLANKGDDKTRRG